MIIYRPPVGSLDKAMEQAREFKSLKKCLITLLDEHEQKLGHIFHITLNDISIEFYSLHDKRVGWNDMFAICCKPYKDVQDKKGYLQYYGDKYDHPLMLFGFFSTDYDKE